MSRSKLSPEKLKAKERLGMVLQLRMAGYIYRDIASQLGIGLATVHRDLNKALKSFDNDNEEFAREMKAIETARLEELIKGIWTKGKGGNLMVIDRLTRLFERKAKLHGLDGPIKIAPTMPDGVDPYTLLTDDQIDDEIKRILAEQDS